MSTTRLLSKWSVLGVIATLMVAFGALMVTTQIRAHEGKGPTGEIGVHVCIDEQADAATTLFRIDENGNCDNLTATTAKHWLSGEGIISGLGALAGTGSVTTIGSDGTMLDPGTATNGFGGTDTLVNIESVNGTEFFDDYIVGNDEANSLRGIGGND